MVMNMSQSKRLLLIYVVILAWVLLGIFGAVKHASFIGMAAYFLALVGFVISYVWGESVRPSMRTSIFLHGKCSSREVLIYVCMALWAVVGTFGISFEADMVELAAYYSALTPFVGSYVIGVSYKPAVDKN